MTIIQQIAKHFRDVYVGGNWTSVNIKETLSDISWHEATAKVGDMNTIATLVFHINYYIVPVLKVLKGGALQASDKDSFDVFPITSQNDWDALVHKSLNDAEQFANEIEKLDEEKLFKDFADAKYGNYY